MVERVAPGRILVPAGMALGVAAGLAVANTALAARTTELTMRVQVVAACTISVAPAGTLAHACGDDPHGRSPPAVQPALSSPAVPMPQPDGPANAAADGGERVRYITVSY